MNKNHIDILIAGSSELVSKYQTKATMAADDSEAEFYHSIAQHFLHIYKKSVLWSNLGRDTYRLMKDT